MDLNYYKKNYFFIVCNCINAGMRKVWVVLSADHKYEEADTGIFFSDDELSTHLVTFITDNNDQDDFDEDEYKSTDIPLSNLIDTSTRIGTRRIREQIGCGILEIKSINLADNSVTVYR
jgi:hypothetical protein